MRKARVSAGAVACEGFGQEHHGLLERDQGMDARDALQGMSVKQFTHRKTHVAHHKSYVTHHKSHVTCSASSLCVNEQNI